MAKRHAVKTTLAALAPRCKDCHHWRRIEEDGAENIGECYRYPPTVFYEDGENVHSYPITEDIEWTCGEFKAAQ